MTIPGLALFYGGMVRSKNVLSVLMQLFVTFSLLGVLWCIYGYSVAFTEGNAFFGGFSQLFLNGVDARHRDGGDLQQRRRDPRVHLHRVPDDVRGDHAAA